MGRSTAIRWFVLAAFAVLVGLASWRCAPLLTWESLSRHEASLRELLHLHPWLTCVAAFGLYVAATAISLPGATVLTLIYGWYLGMARGLIVVSLASTTGAVMAFLLSRYLLRDFIRHRLAKPLAAVDGALARDGAYYLFSIRLIPLFPFFVVNLVMGLTPLSVFTFWWVSQLGMLPGTAVYIFTGASIPRLADLAEHGAGGILTVPLVTALMLLAVFPWLVKRMVSYSRESDGSDPPIS